MKKAKVCICMPCPSCGQTIHVEGREVECSKCLGGGQVAKGKGAGNREDMCTKCVGSGKMLGCQCGEKQKRRDVDISHAAKMGWGPGCTIATAALGYYAETELNLLRGYRDRTAKKYRAGRLLARYYNKIKRPVAAYVSTRSVHKLLIRNLFVRPVIVLQTRRKPYSDIVSLIIYALMLLWVTLLFAISRLRRF